MQCAGYLAWQGSSQTPSRPFSSCKITQYTARQRCAKSLFCRMCVLVSLLIQVIPSFAEELCRKEFGSPGGASGSGFSLTDDMHRRGISVRHMGLLRDMFWRPLEGKVDLSFNSNRVRTKTDMRLQLRRGDQVSNARSSSDKL